MIGISTTIEKGEFVAIMGPSGSGKSTFMNILGCLDTADRRRTIFLTELISGRLSRDELAEIGIKSSASCSRGSIFFHGLRPLRTSNFPCCMTAIRRRERRERALAALKSVGLEGREDHHPNQLSGGQQQRVAIARALVNEAPIILADEPTGNLDTKTSVEIMELFVKLNRESGITVILVTHEPDIATYSKRIIKFLDGRIVSDESGEDKNIDRFIKS